jgi:ADP-heptose:LPS heptosyltransferase
VKILLVQLLRLGDILMTAPIVSALKRKYPGVEIHFLGFRQFSQVEELFSEKVHWHWLDREGLQSALGDPDRSFFFAHDLLAENVAELKGLKFDRVFNLTQTKLSGWLCSQLNVEYTVGLHFDPRAQARFGSPWFQYLNDHMSAGRGEVFHYLDLFRFACEVEGEEIEWKFNREVPKQSLDEHPYILIQPLTSDTKKNYQMAKWRKAIEEFQLTTPGYHVGILAAPSEVELISAAFENLPNATILPCSLTEALSLMDKANLLVTGDTSIKHLSCASLVPVIELSLGSSDFQRTGVYKTASWILQGKTSCSPCMHSSACSQTTHLCADQIPAEAIALAMNMMLTGMAHPKDIAKEFGPQMEWFETVASPMGFWLAKDVRATATEWELLRVIEKSTWKFVLQQQYHNPWAPFGTESLQIRKIFSDRFAEFGEGRWRDQLEFLETEAVEADHNVSALLSSMRKLLEKPFDLSRQEECLESVREFCEDQSETGSTILSWLPEFEKGLLPVEEKVVSLSHLRRLQAQLDEMNRRTQIKLKLIRSLKSQVSGQIEEL